MMPLRYEGIVDARSHTHSLHWEKVGLVVIPTPSHIGKGYIVYRRGELLWLKKVSVHPWWKLK
jgi:hypothetical protein